MNTWNDLKYMQRAIKLAKRSSGKTHPNPIVGCVIVKSNKIIGEGYHKKFGSHHAEIEALKKAGKRAAAANLYVNLEPCTHFGKTPPCVNAIIKAKIKKVIIGMQDPNPVNNGKGIKLLRKAGIKVVKNVCQKESELLNAPFIKYMTKCLPYVTLKLAQSIDGKIATKTGDSKWISSEVSRRLVHKLRSKADAVMVGSGTVISDDPLLTARFREGRGTRDEERRRQPIKIIVDSKLKIPLNARIFLKKSLAKTIIATTKSAPKNKIKNFEKKNAEILIVNSKNNRVDLRALMKMLAKKGIINILVEGGKELSSSLLSEGLVDKIMVFIAPKIIGDKAKVSQAAIVKNLAVRKIDKDYLFEGEI